MEHRIFCPSRASMVAPSRRTFLVGATLAVSGGIMTLAACSTESDDPQAPTKPSSEESDIAQAGSLPPAQPDASSPFGVDANINMSTIDDYLLRDDIAYRDLRLFDDPADYESIGGSSKLSMALEGFTVVPFPYLGTLADLPVAGAYEGNCLFDIAWDGELAVTAAKANYTQSLQILEELFPKDKPIFLMCGGGGYAAMAKALLAHLGWDESLLYNVGGQWDYEGPHLMQIVSYADADRPEYYLWRLDMPPIDFDLLYPAP